LKILSILNYVFGGLGLFGALFPAIYIVLGIVMLNDPQAMSGNNGQAPPPEVGWVLIGIGGLGMCLGGLIACLTLYAGRCIAKREKWMFCFILACFQLLSVPLGTCLGIFTIIVLNRDTVKQQFGRV